MNTSTAGKPPQSVDPQLDSYLQNYTMRYFSSCALALTFVIYQKLSAVLTSEILYVS